MSPKATSRCVRRKRGKTPLTHKVSGRLTATSRVFSEDSTRHSDAIPVVSPSETLRGALVKHRVDTSDSFCGTHGEPVSTRGAVAMALLLAHYVSFLSEILSHTLPGSLWRGPSNTPRSPQRRCDRLCGGNDAQQAEKARQIICQARH